MATITQSSTSAVSLTCVATEVNMSDAPKSRSVVASFNYSPRTLEEGPPEPIAVDMATNLGDSLPRDAKVHDIRGTEGLYNLDTTGFQIVNHVSIESEFIDDQRIKKVYYPEMEALFKQVTGASKVIVFHHTIRRQAYDYLNKAATTTRANAVLPKDASAVPIPNTLRGPLNNVHIDQSYDGAEMLARRHYAVGDTDKFASTRYQVINAWRPIKTILRAPLAVCDARSVLEEELVPIKLIYPERESETFGVRPPLAGRVDGGHKWCYLHKQTPEEVLFFKIFDSKLDVARRVAHSAFVDKEYENEEPRQSVEVRALIFYEEER